MFLRNVDERLPATWHHIPEGSNIHDHTIRIPNPTCRIAGAHSSSYEELYLCDIMLCSVLEV
jgi:hypothetical protein